MQVEMGRAEVRGEEKLHMVCGQCKLMYRIN